MIRVTVDSVRVSLLTQNRVVVLREAESRRYLPIWIGQFEADAISFVLQDLKPKRPMTHDLLRSTIHAMGGEITQVVINDIQDTTFFARIYIQTASEQLELDARSSDAIALALRADAPIFVATHVLDQASVPFDNEGTTDSALQKAEDENDLPVANQPPDVSESPADTPVADDSLSPFRNFINSLDEDDDKPRNQP
jgi:bifunctional DNase/RNase